MPKQSKTSASIFYLIWKTARPYQWIKSAFLLAPALFALRIFDSSVWIPLLKGFFGFSFIASSVYTFNDIFNRSEDVDHPVKKHRPIASGKFSLSAAAVLTAVLLTAGLLLLKSVNLKAALFGASYALLMTIYTLYLRKVYLVDVIIIAIGFVIRVDTGGALISEPVSHWLILCTFTIALFLGMIKRRQEIAAFRSEGKQSIRKSLAQYPDLSVVDSWISVLGGMTVLCYALYTVDPATIAKHNTDKLLYTLPFVLYGIFRYRTVSLSGRAGEDPSELVMKDGAVKIAVALWAVAVGLVLYLA